MNGTEPALTFHVSVRSDASPGALYDTLADLTTSLEWGGKDAPRKTFRLLSMDAPSRLAKVGDTFTSSGENGNGTFHDRSSVVEADPGRRFGFDTDSTFERTHGKTWYARFAHRYTIEPSGTGSVLAYDGEVRPQNYVPYWLRPVVRRMTRVMVNRMIRANLVNLARRAAAARPF
ncbi:MAG TPA: SRPBCC family protein, partial [Actinomycetota bacterium]